MRSMAERCLAGEFDGSARKASRDPECIRLGIDESTIRYHVVRGDPATAAAPVAQRARVAAETAAAEAAQVPVKFIFIERAGSAQASAAVEAAIGVIESQIGVRVERVANCARAEAAIPLQAEIEIEAEKRVALEAELDASKVREAALRLEVGASAARMATLEAKLASTSRSTAAATAKAAATIGATNEGAAKLRKETKAAKRSLSRAKERV